MRRIYFLIARMTLIAWMMSGSVFGLAQSTARLPTVGQLWFVESAVAHPWEEVFRNSLRDLGYVEGRNVKIVARYANGDRTQLPTLLNELIALPADVLLVSTNAVRAATTATKTVPIVSFSLRSALRDGLVTSLARPGGNLTGMYSLGDETAAKRLELAIELVPGLKRIGVIFEAGDGTSTAEADTLRSLARKAGPTVHAIGIRSSAEISAALGAFAQQRSQVLIVADNPFFYGYRAEILRLANHRFPVIAQARDWAKDGALVTYAPDFYDMLRRSAVQVDKILRGIKPGDIAIEQATVFELVVNLKTAKAFGLVVPPSVLVRANEVIR